jgi:hypothetical protein
MSPLKAAALVLFYISTMAFLIFGWVLNLVKLIAIIGGDVSAMFVARLLGVAFFPLGVVLGWAV